MQVTIVGLGLIGGSLALTLKQNGLAKTIVGVDANAVHAKKALALQLVDEVQPLEQAVVAAQLVIIATPVDATVRLLPTILDKVQHQVVMDVGSTKTAALQAVNHHPKRQRYVASHPMWGTEFSGPEAATAQAFKGKAAVICNSEESAPDALELVESIYQKLGMHMVYMSAREHDLHVAYISHISHITSFALANTVLEKEQEENAIFELASGGFESTVRLAKSNADMWVPVLKENRDNVLDVLNEHIIQLQKFKTCLEKQDYNFLQQLILGANQIKRILK